MGPVSDPDGWANRIKQRLSLGESEELDAIVGARVDWKDMERAVEWRVVDLQGMVQRS